MEYALVVLGFVKAVMVADATFISNHGAEAAASYGYASGTWVQTETKVGIGYAYRDSTFYARARGTSKSGTSPATTTTAGDTLTINLHADGAQTITLATSASADLVAADIQAKVRALTPNNEGNSAAFTGFVCFYDISMSRYYLMSPFYGQYSTVVVSGGTVADELKLGTSNGGTETDGDGE